MTLVADPHASGSEGSDNWTAAGRCDQCAAINIATFTLITQSRGKPSLARAAFNKESGYALETMDWQPKNAVVRSLEDVPKGIDEAAGEAIAALTIGAHKSAVLMSRSVIEATAKDQGIDAGSLYGKISKLEEQRVITPSTADAAHEVRFLGNDMAHGDFATTSITEAEAAEVVEIIEAMLAEVYQRPARIERMRQRRTGT